MGSSACTSCRVSSKEKIGEAALASGRLSVTVKDGGFTGADFVTVNRGKFDEFYTINWDEIIGEGVSATVHRTVKKATEQTLAVKVINAKKLKRKETLHQETDILKKLDHPNIVRLIEIFQDEQQAFLVLELCRGGELFDHIVDRGALPERAAATVLHNMLRGVSYIHSNDIVHRDMKAENWLLAAEAKAEKTTIKLADFGLAKHLLPDQMAFTKAGTPYYVAPEVLDADKNGGYGLKADMWGVGVIFYMLLGGAPPFTGDNTQEVIKSVKTKAVRVKSLGRGISEDAKGLLLDLLNRDVQSRITAQDALNHNWITRIMRTESSAKKGGALRSSIKSGNYGHKPQNVAFALKRFSVATTIEKASIHVLATQLKRDELADLEQAFIEMDSNNDGTLNAEEFAEGMKRAGIPLEYEEAIAIFQKIDTDGSGAMDYSEFVAAMMDSSRAGRENDWYKAFKVFDLDGSGTIERHELGQLLKSTEAGKKYKEVDDILKGLDNDGDGKIDFQEFMVMMNGLDRSVGED